MHFIPTKVDPVKGVVHGTTPLGELCAAWPSEFMPFPNQPYEISIEVPDDAVLKVRPAESAAKSAIVSQAKGVELIARLEKIDGSLLQLRLGDDVLLIAVRSGSVFKKHMEAHLCIKTAFVEAYDVTPSFKPQTAERSYLYALHPQKRALDCI